MTKTDPFSVQVGGDHYKKAAIQPIDFILANNLGFCEGNAIKYIYRYQLKGGIEDLEKARHYIDFLIEAETKRATSGPENTEVSTEGS